MKDQDRQALVRSALRRRLAEQGLLSESGAGDQPAAPVTNVHLHASHDIYVTLVNDNDACVIEPSVACTHCNYCKSHGY